MFVNSIFKRTCSAKPAASVQQFQRLAHFNQVNAMVAMQSKRQFGIRSPPQQSDESDDLSVRDVIKLDEFYSDCPEVTMTDAQALEYMNFAADLACVGFKDDKEMLDFKGAFIASLTFLGKLDEVDVKGIAPLGSVLEFYGGN